MLRVAKVRRGREAYYLETTMASSRGRAGLVEPDGVWWGGLAGALGLAERTVEAGSLSTLLAGVDPATGAPLDPRHDRVTVTAFDCTFAAPKSVSLLHALGPQDAVEQVRASHEHAVAGALGYLERHAAHVRRAGATLPAEGFVAASFLHRTSRADDPHLHTHLVVANLAPDEGGRWSALDARPLFVHASVAGALYRAQLRSEISERLSVVWQARAEGFADLIGIPAAALRGFSRRSAEIASELARGGWQGAGAARLAADRTRSDKNLGADYPTLVAAWRERAFALGVSRSGVARLGGRVTRATDGVGARHAELEKRVADAVESLDHAFDRRELIRATCARLDDGASVERVEDAVDRQLASGELVRCGERALRLHATGGGRIPGGLVEARYETKQIAALRCRLDSVIDSAPILGAQTAGRPFSAREDLATAGVLVVGREGDPILAWAALREAALAAHDRGRRVIGLAPDRHAAVHLEAATGITMAAFEGHDRLASGSLVLVAHPERCPVRAVVSLLEEARAQDMTVVLFPRQIPRQRTASPFEHGAAPVAPRSEPVESLRRYRVDDVEVVLAADITAAFSGILLLGEESRSRGRRSLVVAAEPRGLASLGVEVARPRDALSRHRAGDFDLIVFGGARLFGPGIAHVPDKARSHVSVAPVARAPGGDRSFVLELAEPAGLRRELGRSPDDWRARDAWRARAVGSGRRRGAPGIETGSDREASAWSRGARVFNPTRAREPSFSR
jgi:conjugative relaxase-like TrwC/TraI family protein